MVLPSAPPPDEEAFASRRTLPPAPATRSSLPPPSGPSADSSGVRRKWHDVATAVVAAPGSSASDAMDRLEHKAARAYTIVCAGAAVCGLFILPFQSGDPYAKAVLAACLVLLAASQGLYAWLLRRPGGYAIGRSLASCVPNLLTGLALCWFAGPTSGAIVFFPPALFHFSMKRDERAAVIVYVTASVAYLLLAAVILVGWLPDVGIDASRATTFDRWCMVLGAELGFAMTFVLARRTRQAIFASMEDHERAQRDVSKREALLAEARQDLEQALATGGLGRFTETRIGSYTLGRVIGRGGMGEVYEASHLRTRVRAAVKMLHPDGLSEPQRVRRFLREVRVVADLRSPYVARVLEVGGAEATLPFIAMELLEGETLAQRLHERSRMSWPAVVEMVRMVGAGLSAAHEHGIVHRDVKPRNIFGCRTSDGRPLWKVLDFGVSQLAGGATLETQGRLVGTPAFMAPEQVTGRGVTPASDLFSLAAVAYRCLTGRPAFAGPTLTDVMSAVAHAEAPRPSEVAGLPPDLDLVMAIGLARSPEDRFARPDELASAIESACSGNLPEEIRARARALLARRAAA
ncbi:MAG: serine/threonine protein kinase [Deltaproteobacteria bacterium]|nr:serine/threonine protein kinase [Deltaproteobacteria bacterium]